MVQQRFDGFIDRHSTLKALTRPIWAPVDFEFGAARAVLGTAKGLVTLAAHPLGTLEGLAGTIDRAILDDTPATTHLANLYKRVTSASEHDLYSGAGSVAVNVAMVVVPEALAARAGTVGEVGTLAEISNTARVVDLGLDSSRLTLNAPTLAGFETATGTVKAFAAERGLAEVGVPATRSSNPLSQVLDFDAHGNEIFYRSMSPADYARMQRTGAIPATGETFVSPSQAYSAGYDGVLVRVTTAPGTAQQLSEIGVVANPGTANLFPGMPVAAKGWTANNAMLKLEGNVVNTSLGRGSALTTFNKNIVKFEQLPK